MLLINKLLPVTLFLLLSQTCLADIAVIVNPSNTNQLTPAEVRQIFLGKTHAFPNGQKVVPYDLPDSEPGKEVFAEQVLRKSISSLNSYWSRMLFSSKGNPPAIVTTDKALQTVAANKNAIAYIDTQHVNNNVKVLFTVPQ